MKSKIKKRVDGKKGYTGIVFVSFIILVLVVGLVFIFINKDVLIEKFNKNGNEKVNKKDEVILDNSKYKDVDISSPYVDYLFNLVHAKVVGGDSTIYKNKKLDVSEMEDFYKFQLASNLYDGYAKIYKNAGVGEITASISEEEVKKYYELLFGRDTYKAIEAIPYTCTNMLYDTVNRRYVTTNQVCGSVSPFNAYEKIIDVKKDEDELLITGAVVFAAAFNGSLCKDFECNTIIDNFASNETDEEYFHKYIDKNLDKLMHYTYKFKSEDDGFYYYQGFERTKE